MLNLLIGINAHQLQHTLGRTPFRIEAILLASAKEIPYEIDLISAHMEST